MDEDKKLTLEGQEVTIEELEEKKKNLASNQRIVESGPGVYQILERMEG